MAATAVSGEWRRRQTRERKRGRNWGGGEWERRTICFFFFLLRFNFFSLHTVKETGGHRLWPPFALTVNGFNELISTSIKHPLRTQY